MPGHHFEQFVQLAGLTADDALIAWGGFYFRDADDEQRRWGIVPDAELGEVSRPRRRSAIGAGSLPYGQAEVIVTEEASGRVAGRATTTDANHVWVRGLRPDTDYRYRIVVDGREWGRGPHRAWRPGPSGRPDLVESARTYEQRFRTFPAPDRRAPARFAVLGDFGVGILAAADGNGQRQLRLAGALERAIDAAGVRFVLTTGDNVYVGEEDTVAGTGDTDEDWYFSYYEPYRYVIERVPVYPGVGNHDSGESELSENRDQLDANFFTDLRFSADAAEGRASVDPGLYYRFSYGADLDFVAIDTTVASELEQRYFFDHPRHRAFLEAAFPAAGADTDGPRWRIPFSHHPPFCAGPHHGNMQPLVERVVPLLERAGVRAMFSGHEHNFQHNRSGGIGYLVSGAGGKLRTGEPGGFAEARTRTWAAEGHLLVVDVDGDRMLVHPVTDVDPDGRFTYLQRRAPGGEPVTGPIEVPLER